MRATARIVLLLATSALFAPRCAAQQRPYRHYDVEHGLAGSYPLSSTTGAAIGTSYAYGSAGFQASDAGIEPAAGCLTQTINAANNNDPVGLVPPPPNDTPRFPTYDMTAAD
jgi:hypothetical protein